jgi:hypothetical protein
VDNFPQFGHRRLGDFGLAKKVDHLNHGGYGATPRLVLEAGEAARLAMEADPQPFSAANCPIGYAMPQPA